MKVWIDIFSPAEVFTHAEWPQGVPYPAIGDKVLLRSNEVTWVFAVLKRTIGIGHDPATNGPGAHVSITVDSPAPEGFRL